MTLLDTLVARDLRHDPADPNWPDRDRLLLVTAHANAPPDAAVLIGAPPGLALGAAVGQAIAERLLAARFGRSLIDHRIWVQASAADLICGAGREAAHVAGALALSRLAVLASLPHDDPTLRAAFTAAGWAVRLVEPGGAEAALAICRRAQRPTLMLAIGAEAQEGSRETAARGVAARRAWLKRLRRHASREAFQHALSGHLPPGWQRACQPETPPPDVAGAITPALTRLAPVLGDLATLPLSVAPILPPPVISAFAPGALSWDGLDLAAPACLLGLALHGGILPVSQTGTEVDLPRQALRHAASLRLRWLHTIIQSDSAPAPPLPHLAIPNLVVFQPADAAEALDCLVLALRRTDGPSIMTLSVQPDPPAPVATHRLCARGAYLVHAPPAPDLTLLAAGAGLALAAATRALLVQHGLAVALVSMPCRALWDGQDQTYRRSVLGGAPVIAFGADPLAFAGLVGAGDLLVGEAAWPPAPDAAAAAILRHLRDGAASKPLD